VRYQIKSLSTLLRTPVGRTKFFLGVGFKLWPVLSYLTMLYRRIFIPQKRVIAVVGSFGKSTTMRAINAATGSFSTDNQFLNSYSMVALNLIVSGLKGRHAVIEVGIDGKGQMARYAWMLRPDIAVVTSIGSEHNRSLKSLEVTREEKSLMARALTESGTAVLNGDDPNVLWMVPRIKARVVKFGMAETNDVRASDIQLDWPRGTTFRLHANGKIHDMKTRLIGKNGVYAILAAVAVALSEGFSIESILSRIQAVSPTPGRLEPVVLENGVILLRDDFKSSLETIDAALDILEEIPAERKIVIMGEVSEPPGSQGPIYGKIGERIGRIASKAILIGGNYQRYATGAIRGGLQKSSLIKAGRDVLYVAELIKNELKPGDVVLVKGRTDQRLERISLFITGRKVICNIYSCKAAIRCDTCPMLGKGWTGLKVVI
jgi:UDP-N-acetylmuramoyl-tripeptide--D-alanyl-D-alanine ligase